MIIDFDLLLNEKKIKKLQKEFKIFKIKNIEFYKNMWLFKVGRLIKNTNLKYV